MKNYYYIIFLALVLIGAGAYYYIEKRKNKIIDTNDGNTTEANSKSSSEHLEAVKNLQRYINKLANDNILIVDGIFGKKTYKAYKYILSKPGDHTLLKSLFNLI